MLRKLIVGEDILTLDMYFGLGDFDERNCKSKILHLDGDSI